MFKKSKAVIEKLQAQNTELQSALELVRTGSIGSGSQPKVGKTREASP